MIGGANRASFCIQPQSSMHVVTGFLVVVALLHFSGMLMPLIYAMGIALVLAAIWGVAKLIQSTKEQSPSPRFGSVATKYPEARARTLISEVPVASAATTSASGAVGDRFPQVSRSMTYLTGTSDIPTSGLIIRPEPLTAILNGSKTWEMRSITTKKRGSIALIGKGSKQILGIATIVDVHGPLSDLAMTESVEKHQIVPARLQDAEVQKLRYAWVLANVRKLDPPVPYQPRSGAVRFVNLTEGEVAGIEASLRRA